MTLGDYGLKSALLVVEKMTMKSNTDAVKGKLYADDGAGLVLATAALAAVAKVVMANEDHDYSEEVDHDISVTVVGLVECAKVAGSGLARKGDKIMISATAGECTKFVKGIVSQANTFATATDQAAIDTNLGRIGTAYETSADADTTQKMWLGVF
jgi:hypothetical protein